MKTLYILRHGKAEPNSPTGDFGRELADSGKNDVKRVAHHLKDAGVDLVVTSDAARAVQTAQTATAKLHVNLVEEHDIYDAGVETLIKVIRDFPARAGCVVIVGHNPGLEALLYQLAADKSTATWLKTSALAHLELDIVEWADVAEGCGRIIAIHIA